MTTRGWVPERSMPLAFPKVWGARPRRAISWFARRTCCRREASSMVAPGGAGKRLPDQSSKWRHSTWSRCKLARTASVYLSDGSRHRSGTDDDAYGGRCRGGGVCEYCRDSSPADLQVSARLHARRRPVRNAHPGVLPESASALGEFPRRIERDHLADAHCHQPSEGSLA